MAARRSDWEGQPRPLAAPPEIIPPSSFPCSPRELQLHLAPQKSPPVLCSRATQAQGLSPRWARLSAPCPSARGTWLCCGRECPPSPQHHCATVPATLGAQRTGHPVGSVTPGCRSTPSPSSLSQGDFTEADVGEESHLWVGWRAGAGRAGNRAPARLLFRLAIGYRGEPSDP